MLTLTSFRISSWWNNELAMAKYTEPTSVLLIWLRQETKCWSKVLLKWWSKGIITKMSRRKLSIDWQSPINRLATVKSITVWSRLVRFLWLVVKGHELNNLITLSQRIMTEQFVWHLTLTNCQWTTDEKMDATLNAERVLTINWLYNCNYEFEGKYKLVCTGTGLTCFNSEDHYLE